ncbi:MAG: GIY-YIG nuclease family protein [Patescibacteria group bacterium]|nr:GIY-YIG nuclease family protein [Patescibacteria group bacterium]
MYYFYILRCSDNSLYSGVTTNPKRRVKEHNFDNVKASKYTRARRPVKLVYTEKHKSKESALKREAEVKSWKKKEKEKLISSN